jgi:hypothetical protein
MSQAATASPHAPAHLGVLHVEMSFRFSVPAKVMRSVVMAWPRISGGQAEISNACSEMLSSSRCASPESVTVPISAFSSVYQRSTPPNTSIGGHSLPLM